MARIPHDKGRSVAVPQPRTGSEVIIATHNFCDPCSWFYDSTRTTGETATDSGDGLTWTLPHTNLIRMDKGKVLKEDDFAAKEAHGYAIKVYVDAVEQTMREPYALAGGDYEVDEVTGAITFYASKAGSTVTADYSYESGSRFQVVPDAGKNLQIEHAEVQFAEDATFEDEIVFEVRMLAEYYDAMNGDPPGTTAPVGTPLPVSTVRYKHFDNLIDEAMGAFPVISPIGGPRGVVKKRYGFPFRYGTIRELDSAAGLDLVVYLKNGNAFGGERATATFYCISKDSGS